MFAEALESRGEHLQCAVSPWGEHSVHPTNHTADLRNSDFRVGYLDTLALTRLSFCATHPSQGCNPVSSCTLSMFGLEWVTSREKAALEEEWLVTQWVAFFPLSQYWTKHPHAVLRGAVLLKLLSFGHDWETKLLTTYGFWNLCGPFSAVVAFTQYLAHIPAWKIYFTHLQLPLLLQWNNLFFTTAAQCISKNTKYFMLPFGFNTAQNGLHTHDKTFFHMPFFIRIKGYPGCPAHTCTVLPQMLIRNLYR